MVEDIGVANKRQSRIWIRGRLGSVLYPRQGLFDTTIPVSFQRTKALLERCWGFIHDSEVRFRLQRCMSLDFSRKKHVKHDVLAPIKQF